MDIKTVSLIGLGALGILYGHQLSEKLSKDNLRIIADKERIGRYQRDGITCNGVRCDFNFVSPDEKGQTADLILIAVKFNSLDHAVDAIGNHVGPDTVILSLLNGISSEEVIGRRYGPENIPLCVAQGMDAVKVGNALTYQNKGYLIFGDARPGIVSESVCAVNRFFNETGIAHEVHKDMKKHQWSKFMLNAGANQVTAVYTCDYAGIQTGGPFQSVMISAMEEVAKLAQKEGVTLTEADIVYWIKIIDSLNPRGKTSMQQDAEARRFSEVDMFGGAIISLARAHGLETPVNRLLYEKIKALESTY